MTKKPKWAKKLTAKELRHLAEGSATGRPTLRSIKVNLEGQAASSIVCFECQSIAAKIGLAA